MLVSISCPFILIAQKEYIPTNHTGYMHHDMYLKAITDTLTAHFDSATATLYVSPTGGFASGNSGYHELAKVQEFDVDSSYTIEGVLLWFGYKMQLSAPTDSSAIDFVLYNMDSTANINGIGRFVPRTLLQSKEVLIADVDTSQDFTSGINVWNFPSFIVYHNYAIGMRFEKLHMKDTIALFSSTNGDPPVPSLSWEYWQGGWNTLLNNWGLDVDLAVFPLVDMTNLGFEQTSFVNGLKLHLYPNPASTFIQVEMVLDNDTELGMVLYDLQGRPVHQFAPQPFASGLHQQTISLEGISAGTYYFLLYTNDHRGIAKTVVIR